MSVTETKYKYYSYGKNINIREVELSDAEFILELRCNEELGKYINKTENNLDKQIQYLENYKKKNENGNTEYYFVIENKQGERLGVCRFYDLQPEEKSICPGSWIIKRDAPASTAIECVLNTYEITFYGLGIERFHLDVRKDNVKVNRFHRSYGCKLIDENDLDYFYYFYKEQFPAMKQKYAKYGPVTLAEMDKLF